MRIAIIDNYDSFTYNLAHIVEQFCEQVITMRNNKIDWQEIKACDKIIFSPGPGLPSEAKAMEKILDKYANQKAILGVCLGMQCIAEYYGAKIINLQKIIHGIPKATFVTDKDETLFSGIPTSFESGRYHSWTVSRDNFPACLKITATDKSKLIMALRHNSLDVCGLQFHPESIMTPHGKQMLKNWILA